MSTLDKKPRIATLDFDSVEFYQSAFSETPFVPPPRSSSRLFSGMPPLKESLQPMMIEVKPLRLRNRQAEQRRSRQPSFVRDEVHSTDSTPTGVKLPSVNGIVPDHAIQRSNSTSSEGSANVQLLAPAPSPFNAIPLSLSLAEVGQNFLDMEISVDGHGEEELDLLDDMPVLIASSPHVPLVVKRSKPAPLNLKPRRPVVVASNDTRLGMGRIHSVDDVRPGLSPPTTPMLSPRSRLFAANAIGRSFSSPLVKRLSIASLENDKDDYDYTIPSKASETLGAHTISEDFMDDRPMTPLRAGAKALRLLGGLEDAAAAKKGKGLEKRKKDASRPVSGHENNDTESKFMFAGYSITNRNKKGQSKPIMNISAPRSLSPGIDEYGNMSYHSDRSSESAWLLSETVDEKVVGVLPLPRIMSHLPASRCSSLESRSQGSISSQEDRLGGNDLTDDVYIVGQVGARSSGESERPEVARLLGASKPLIRRIETAPSLVNSRQNYNSSDMRFLAVDPYAQTRGPREEHSRPKRRPPPLALTISNGKTKDMPALRPRASISVKILGGVSISAPNDLPYTPFARPRVAPSPPHVGRSSSDSIIRPAISHLMTDLPRDVSINSEPNEPFIVLEDPHRKGKSFFIEDESPTQGTFGAVLAKKITLKNMSGGWRKAVGNKI